MAGIADINVRVGAYLRPLEQGLDRAERDLRKFGNKMTNLGTQLSTTLSTAFAGLAIASVKAYGEFERLEKGLDAVTKSTVPASQQIDRLKTLAEAPGLGFEQAVIASTRLQAVGFSAQFAEKTIKEVANAVATTGGTAENFDSVNKQFTQMIAKGKLLQEDLGIIQENMPVVAGAIEKAFGTNNVEKIRASGVTAQEFVQKVVGELGNLKRVEGGLSNSMDNLGQSVRFFFVSVGKEINEAFNLQENFDGLSKALNQASEWFAGLDENVQRNIIRFGLFLATIGPALFILGKLAAVGQVIVNGFKTLTFVVRGLGAAFTFLSSPITVIIAGVAALAVAGVYLVKNWDSTKAAFTNIWIGIKNFFLKTINSLLKGVDQFVSAVTFGVAKSNLAEEFSFKTQDYVDVPKWKSFGDTMKEVGGDLLEYAGLASKAKKKTQELNEAVFSGDGGAAITGGDPPAVKQLKEAEKERLKQIAEQKAFAAQGASPTIGGGGVATVSGGLYTDQDISLNQRYAETINQLTAAKSSLNTQNMDLALSQDSINASLVRSVPSMELFKSQIEGLGLAFDQITEKAMPNFTGAVATGLDAFASYAQKGITSFKDLARGVLGASAAIVKALIRQGVIAAVANAFKSAPGPLGIALAAGAGALAEGLFTGLMGKLKVPALATGGRAFGETLAIIGDYPSAGSDPELVERKSRIKDVVAEAMGGGGGGASETVIRGEDLYIIFKRAQARMDARIS